MFLLKVCGVFFKRLGGAAVLVKKMTNFAIRSCLNVLFMRNSFFMILSMILLWRLMIYFE